MPDLDSIKLVRVADCARRAAAKPPAERSYLETRLAALAAGWLADMEHQQILDARASVAADSEWRCGTCREAVSGAILSVRHVLTENAYIVTLTCGCTCRIDGGAAEAAGCTFADDLIARAVCLGLTHATRDA